MWLAFCINTTSRCSRPTQWHVVVQLVCCLGLQCNHVTVYCWFLDIMCGASIFWSTNIITTSFANLPCYHIHNACIHGSDFDADLLLCFMPVPQRACSIDHIHGRDWLNWFHSSGGRLWRSAWLTSDVAVLIVIENCSSWSWFTVSMFY